MHLRDAAMMSARAHMTLRLLAILVIALAAVTPRASRSGSGARVGKATTASATEQGQARGERGQGSAANGASNGAGSLRGSAMTPTLARR